MLENAFHCRNCGVYSSAATRRLEEELPRGYLDHWTAHFAHQEQPAAQHSQNILVFRIGVEWLALSPHCLQEIAEDRPIHSVPHRRNKSLLGVVNIGGELLICLKLDVLLGLEGIPPSVTESKRIIYRRLVVATREGSRFVFPVDEVHGVHRFNPKDLKEVPCTVTKVHAAYIRGILLLEGKSIGCLDDQLLFSSLERGLA